MACIGSDCSYNTNGSILPPALESNPDISGIGVLIGFMGTAYITFGILVLQFLIGAPENTNFSNSINLVDKHLLEFVWRKVGKPPKRLEPALKSIVLTLSDAQIVTGLSILASGYSQIGCGLSIFHWHIVVFLAWFSSATHLTTLTFLRRYIHDKRGFRALRLSLMLFLVCLLSIALIPTGGQCGIQNMDNIQYYTDVPDVLPQHITSHYSSDFLFPGAPVKCCFGLLFKSEFEDSDRIYLLSMVASQAVLLISSVTRATKMFRWSSLLAKEWLRHKPARVCERAVAKLEVASRTTQTKGLRQFCLVINCGIIVFIIFARALCDLLESSLWEISWLMFSLAWGTTRMFVVRRLANQDWARNKADEGEVVLQENFWGFGQWMATALLVLPFLGFLETYLDGRQVPAIKATAPKLETNTLSGEDSPAAATAGDSASNRSRSIELQRARPRNDTNPEVGVDNSADITLAPRTGTDLSNLEQQLGSSTEIAPTNPVDSTEENPHARQTASPLQGTQRPWPAQAFYDHDFHEEGWHWEMLICMYSLLVELGVELIVFSSGVGSKTIQAFLSNFQTWEVYVAVVILYLYTAMCISVERQPTRIDGLILGISRDSHKTVKPVNGRPSTEPRHRLFTTSMQPVQITRFAAARRVILFGIIFMIFPFGQTFSWIGCGLAGVVLIITCALLGRKRSTQALANNTNITRVNQSRSWTI